MPGTARLMAFALQALLLLLPVSALWLAVAAPYNRLLVLLASPLAPGAFTLKVVGAHILVDGLELSSPVSVDGLALHWGLVLLVVLALASTGLSLRLRLKWLALLIAAALLAHTLGLALLAHGAALAAGKGTGGDEALRLVFSAFAVAWGLLPAIAGGIWCFACWLPRIKEDDKTQGGQLVHNRDR